MTRKEFAKIMREFRQRNDFSQRDAAEFLGCSKRSLENWEQARSMPRGFGLSALLRIIDTKQKVSWRRKR